jgi:hypothetical protein
MTKELIQSMIANGYNLNQIAAIYMISKTELEKMLVSAPVEKKSKKVEDTPLFEDEPGL